MALVASRLFVAKLPSLSIIKAEKEILPHKELEGTVLDDYP